MVYCVSVYMMGNKRRREKIGKERCQYNEHGKPIRHLGGQWASEIPCALMVPMASRDKKMTRKILNV